jgi:hypothetical protein
MTECNQSSFGFEASGKREIVARFDGGTISSDGGALLLRQTDKRLNLLPRLAACFLDGRNQDQVEHSILEMISQRIYGLALGYEDLNDHEELRKDPVFGVLAGREELNAPLAGKSTLNRMELGAGVKDRYKKITFWKAGVDELLVKVFIESYPSARPRSCWTSIPPTCRCMVNRKGGSFTVITIATVIYRCTFFVESRCCARACGNPITTQLSDVCKRSNELWVRFGKRGRR